MAQLPPVNPRSRTPLLRTLRWRLPILVALLIAGAFIAFLTVTYHEVDAALLRSARQRAQAAADELAGLLGNARQRVSDMNRVAADPTVQAFLRTRSPDERAAAENELRSLVIPGTQLSELWGATGERVLSIASSPQVDATFPREAPSGPLGFRLDKVGQTIVSTLSADVQAPDVAHELLGRVIVRRPVVNSATSTDVLNRLLGTGAKLEIGGTTGSWTDLVDLVPAPPFGSVGSVDGLYRSAIGEERLGAVSAISGTPLLVWVSFPRAPVASQTRGFLRDMAAIAGLFVVLVALLSASATTRLVRPLAALTAASEAVAAGNFDRLVTVERTDEIGRLAQAFRAMVGQLRDGQARLIERAAHATCLAEVAGALAEDRPMSELLCATADAMSRHLAVGNVTVWIKSTAGAWLDREWPGRPQPPFGDAYTRLPIGFAEIGRIAEYRRPVVTNDVLNDAELHYRRWSSDQPVVAFAGFPLEVNDQLVGVLAFTSEKPFGDRETDILPLLARTLAVGISRRQLEDSRTQLVSILDSAADFVTIGRVHGPPLYLNRAIRRALGLGLDDSTPSLLSLRPEKFHKEFETVVLPTIERAGTWAGETEYIARDGRVIPVSQVSVGHRGPDGQLQYVSTIARDITEQKRAESALRQSEGRFRRIAETITEVFWMADVDLARMIYISPGYERIWGRSCESLYDNPRSFLDAIHPEDRKHVVAGLGAQAAGAPFEHEYRIVRPGGEVRWIWDRGFPVADGAGRVTQYVGAAQDITERKAADAQVRLLARAIESTSEMVSVTDLDERLTFVNRAFLDTFGYAASEVLGATPALLKPSAEYNQLYADISRGTRAGGWQGELPVRRQDGSRLIVSLMTSPIRDDAGHAVGYLGVARDITSRRALEEQLRQSQKMEAIGQLAGGVAHDFNNLLTAIHGYALLVRDSLQPTDQRHEDVDQIRQAAERATALTRQLLAFSRRQILAPRVLRLGDIVRELTPMLCRLLGEAVDLKTLVSDQGFVKADTGQLEQVLMNLAVNAHDAMPNGGQLTIETVDVNVDGGYWQQHANLTPGPYVMLAVSDTGVGMDRQTQDRVFEPFFTTKPAGQGTGLGLATVHGIVNQSGGHIWLYSEVGRGTTFKLYFPRTADEPDVVTGEPSAPPPRGNETILLVEDETAVREFARRILGTAGYTVFPIANPKEAIDFSRTSDHRIDVIVTDVVLPTMNGKDLAEKLREHRPNCAVMFMSGYTDDAIVRHGVLEPGTWFLQKPFTAEALLTKVRDLLDSDRGRSA